MRYLFILSFASASWASSALRVRNQTLARPAVSVNTAALPQSSDVHSGHQRGGQDYVVLFDTQHPEPPDVANVLRQIGLDVSHPDVSHVFSNSAFRGFAGTMNNHCVSALNAMSAVSHVQRGFNMSTHSVASRKGSPWGLQRVSQSTAVAGADGRLAFDYQYEDGGELGAGVDLYVLDSGINTEHQDFGGRAKMVFPEALANQVDGLGHGTHCAGTAAGSVYGVASGANVLGVKVVTDDNTAPISDVVAGVDFIIRNHDRRRSDPSFVGSVVSISFGTLSDPTSGDTPLYNAVVRQATAAGVHVSMSAGNHADDACKFTPASAGGQNGDAVTVGAMAPGDRISSISNSGPCVDVYAPGEKVVSAWIGGGDFILEKDGTSTAAPHVAGLMAYHMARNPTLAASPAAMKDFLKSNALSGFLKALPSTVAGDPLLLVNNGERIGRGLRQRVLR